MNEIFVRKWLVAGVLVALQGLSALAKRGSQAPRLLRSQPHRKQRAALS